MAQKIIGIRREDLDKVGEKRVSLSPKAVQSLLKSGCQVHLQSAVHPETGESKRAYSDAEYLSVGAEVTEDLSAASVIFGLKEVKAQHLIPERPYLFFSHTHKGQVKNRPLLRSMVEKGITLMDYELMVNAKRQRVITAFTYFAGYAGMVDSIWAYGKRLQVQGTDHPFAKIPQSIEWEDLNRSKQAIKEVGEFIREHGTPQDLPPLITCFLGNGKTSTGATEIYRFLPVQAITLEELPDIFANGSRKQVYELVLDVPQMFRLKAGSAYANESRSDSDLFQLYLREPDEFESNLDQVLPYLSILMNCIIWSPKFPRLISRTQAKEWLAAPHPLQVIGDITCDPEGAIQFSKETWISDPVFLYDPATDKSAMGFDGEGVAVMAVTNLPCEFSADASQQFSQDLGPYLHGIAGADYAAEDPSAAGLPPEIQASVILWKGKLQPNFTYMEAYLKES
ncbi:MAG: hypothetical protein AAF399_21345 [Bacteroidota bacterium]